MRSSDAGGMLALLGGESMRGSYREKGKLYLTSAANFSYELNTGNILLFANAPYFPPEIKQGIKTGTIGGGTFKVATNPDHPAYPKIVHVLYDTDNLQTAKTSREARRVLDASVVEYNAALGW